MGREEEKGRGDGVEGKGKRERKGERGRVTSGERGGSEGVPEGQVFRVHLLFFVRGQRVKKTAMAGWWSLGGAFLLLFAIILAPYLYKINWIKVSPLLYLCPAYLLILHFALLCAVHKHCSKYIFCSLTKHRNTRNRLPHKTANDRTIPRNKPE